MGIGPGGQPGQDQKGSLGVTPGVSVSDAVPGELGSLFFMLLSFRKMMMIGVGVQGEGPPSALEAAGPAAYPLQGRSIMVESSRC